MLKQPRPVIKQRAHFSTDIFSEHNVAPHKPRPHFAAFRVQNKLKKTGPGHQGFHLPKETALTSSLALQPKQQQAQAPYLCDFTAENSSEVMCFRKLKQKKKI